MKRVISFLLAMLLFAAAPISLAEDDLTTQLLHEMAEAGNIEQITPWAFPGVYCFGENMEAPYITLSIADHADKLEGAISWRMYPKVEQELESVFFPMLRVLMLQFCEDTDVPLIDAWLSRQQIAMSDA